MPRIEVGDIEVQYEVVGSGPPLLLIGGTGGDLRNSPTSMYPLVEHFSVVGYDQRGLGRTTKPDQPYTMKQYADDASALLDRLDIARAHVVGISFGGMVGQYLASRHPGRVHRLVLACTSPGGAMPSADLLALNSLSPSERAAAYVPLFDTRAVDGTVPDDLQPILARMAERPPLTDPVDLMGARRQLEARAGHDMLNRLDEIRSPTLVIGGRTDGIATPENLEALADGIPDAELRFCHGGHAFLFQDPDAWPAIIDFLRR